MKTLQDIFNSDYDKRLLTDGVLKDTFGDLFTEYEFAENFLRNANDQDHAQKAGITSVEKIGHVSGFDTPLSVFEITLAPSVRIKYSRVNIQKFLRSVLYGESAFLIFHYEDLDDNDWRFSFLHVEKGNTTTAKRFTYLLGKAHKARTVAERFEKLKEQILEQRHGVINDQVLFDAFSVEALSDEFFNKYKTIYANFIQYITGKRVVKTGSKWEEKILHEPDTELYAAFGKDDKRIRDYVKKLMGRITFLYFVQEKRWFNNDQNYLQHLFENSTPEHQNDFLDCVLEPFFYTVLNTEKPNRKQAFEAHNNNLRPSEVKWDESLLDQWKEIPFLNGGLFERDENDIVRSQFPPQFFENLNDYDENFVGKIPQKDAGYTWERIPGIFDLFSQYNFTIDENDPDDAEVGIDPEMLGKIFENLLEDNKDKGAFYTPKEIVQYMCRESLIAYLQTDAKDDAHKERLRKFVETHDASVLENPEYVRHKIKEIKVCDPAIGSGAFPMGMLDQLVACSEALDMHISNRSNRAEIKKHIIQNSIYGVDIERGAVDIARLRFWLSLVIDEEKAIPLPNLDYKIMQGNSLLEQYEGIDLSKLKQKSPTIKDVKPHRNLFGEIEDKQLSITFNNQAESLSYFFNQYYNCRQHEAKTKYKNLIEDSIRKIVEHNFGVQIEIHQMTIDLESASVEKNNKELETIKEILNANNNQLSILQKKQNLTPNEKLQVTTLKKAIDNANKQYVSLNSSINESKKKINYATNEKLRYENAFDNIQQIDLSANQQFFLWHTWFADVFNRPSNQGFDVVIGNPPYIQLQNNGGALADSYESCGYKTLEKTGDIYCLFYERTMQLLKDGGISCLITSNKWMRAGYGESLRKFFVENTDPKMLIDFAGVKVFDSATVDTNILLAQKASNTHSTQCCITKELTKNDLNNLSGFVRQHTTVNAFSCSDSWVILSPIEQSIKRKIEAVGTPLKDWDINIYRGVLTGYNEAFIIDTKKRDEILANCSSDEERKKTAELIRPILRGRDIKRYGYDWANLWLICTHNGVKGKFPRIDVKDYPAIKAHLDTFGSKVTKRSDQGDTPYNLRNCAYWEDFDKPKIVWGNLNLKGAYSYAPKGMFVNAPSPFIATDNVALLHILNSKIADYYIQSLGVTRNGGYFEYKPMFVAQLPVPMTGLENLKTFNTQPSREEEGEIATTIYQIYGLSPDEIDFIEDLCI